MSIAIRDSAYLAGRKPRARRDWSTPLLHAGLVSAVLLVAMARLCVVVLGLAQWALGVAP